MKTKSEIHKTLKSTFDSFENRDIKSNAFYEKYKNDIFIPRCEAIKLYDLGMDCRFLKPKLK